jgi:hypothetical protein
MFTGCATFVKQKRASITPRPRANWGFCFVFGLGATKAERQMALSGGWGLGGSGTGFSDGGTARRALPRARSHALYPRRLVLGRQLVQ